MFSCMVLWSVDSTTLPFCCWLQNNQPVILGKKSNTEPEHTYQISQCSSLRVSFSPMIRSYDNSAWLSSRTNDIIIFSLLWFLSCIPFIDWHHLQSLEKLICMQSHFNLFTPKAKVLFWIAARKSNTCYMLQRSPFVFVSLLTGVSCVDKREKTLIMFLFIIHWLLSCREIYQLFASLLCTVKRKAQGPWVVGSREKFHGFVLVTGEKQMSALVLMSLEIYHYIFVGNLIRHKRSSCELVSKKEFSINKRVLLKKVIFRISGFLASQSILTIYMLFSVLPSTGIGALSAREAEGRANISSAEKVQIPYSISAFLAISMFLEFRIYHMT